MQPARHAAYTEMTTMPNLPNPVAVRLTIGDEVHRSGRGGDPRLRNGLMHMAEARLSRRLVIRDSARRRTIIDSERFASWENPHLVAFRYRVTPDGHDAPVTRGTDDPHRGEQCPRPASLRRGRRAPCPRDESGCTVRLAKPEQYLTITQAMTLRHDARSVEVDVVAVVHADAARCEEIATRALAEGFERFSPRTWPAVRQADARAHAEIHADALSDQGFRFGCLHLEMALCRDNPRVSVPIKGLTGEGYRFMIFWDTDYHLFPYYLLTIRGRRSSSSHYRYHLLDAARRNARAWG